MCHGMGLTASAVGERIALVWSLSQLLRELDINSLRGLCVVTAPSRSATAAHTASAQHRLDADTTISVDIGAHSGDDRA